MQPDPLEASDARPASSSESRDVLCVACSSILDQIAQVCREAGLRPVCAKDEDEAVASVGDYALAVVADRVIEGAPDLAKLSMHLVQSEVDGVSVQRGLLVGACPDHWGHQHAYVHHGSSYCRVDTADGRITAAGLAALRVAIDDALGMPPYVEVTYYDAVADAVLHSIVESSQAPLVVIDAGRRVWFANVAAQAIFRRPTQLMKGLDVAALFATPEDAAQLLALLAEDPARAGQTCESRMRTRNGRVFDALVSFGRVYDDRTPGLVGFTVQDVTERNRAEEALRASEARYRSVMETLPVIVYSAEAMTNRLLLMDGAVRSMLGHPPEAFLADPDLGGNIVHQEDRTAFGHAFKVGLASLQPFELEFRVVRPDGRIVWLHERVVPIVGRDGRMLRHDGVAVDITRRKEAEDALRRAHQDLEVRVEDRTAELRRVNEQLRREITDRRETESALRESEQRFRLLAENMPGVVYLCRNDARYTMLYLNDAVEVLTGHAKEEFLADRLSFVELYHPDDVVGIFAEVNVAVSERRPFHLTYRIRHRSGAWRWVEEHGAGIYQDEELAYLEGVILDVTDRKRAETALQESEARFRMVTESALSGVYVIQDGLFRYVNPGLARIFGYDGPVEIIDRLGPYDLTDPSDRPIVDAHVRRRLDGEVESVQYQFTGRRKGGERIECEVLGRRVDYQGRPAIIGTLVDITKRKEAETALRESEVRHRTILDQMQEAVVYADRDNIIRHINAFACELFNVDRDAAIGQNLLAFHAPELHERVAAAIRAFREDGHRNVVALRRSVGERELMFRFSPVHGPDGSYQGIIANLIDLTEQVRMQRQLAEAQRMEAVATLAGGIAHDFNNLMTTVLALASHMKKRRRPDHPEFSSLDQIENAAATAGRLAHQLLVFAKGGKIMPRVLPFGDVVARAQAIVQPTVPAGLRLTWDVSPSLWTVECDSTQVEQVIVNLCRNAFEAIAGPGEVVVRAGNVTLGAPPPDAQPSIGAGQYVCVSVADTGCGMSPDVLRQAFDPFFTTKPSGYGLGLAAAFGIAKSHGGAISVSSEVGSGSTFRVWLPRAPVDDM